MNDVFHPRKNFEKTMREIGYVSREKATEADYQRIGFKSGLEVHQQLKTREKLFCHCPAGLYYDNHEFDAEVIRHMRPAMSELGQYDGTALMEFKTKKNIFYHIKNQTACTYEVDDTPPFKINREALEIALGITLLSKLSVVGEVHITRKQYLDGSIPTGFQRTAILGVDGEIQLKNKKVRLIQLSIEEDSCREVSDIGHNRVYKTDRLGMPLIETVTYPDMLTPDELMEAAQYIRFINRSTGNVRTGIGAGREDVNVSCKGGTRVEIKGVSRNSWIPALSHNEAFRQWALLHIRQKLLEQYPHPDEWQMAYLELDYYKYGFTNQSLIGAYSRGEQIIGINLPGFKGTMSHFTQPGKAFTSEFEHRLKVIACIEMPNMVCSEDLFAKEEAKVFEKLRQEMEAGPEDAQIILWGPTTDIPTAIETVEERARMAFQGVPNETRKSFADGTTIFERVLPGADRMYPDTDSAPIPLTDEYIDQLRKNLPKEIALCFQQFREWGIPEDTYTYLMSKNLYPLIEKLVNELDLPPKYIGTFLGHQLKRVEGKYKRKGENFNYYKIYRLFAFLKENQIHHQMARYFLNILYKNPKLDMESIMITLKFKKREISEVIDTVDVMINKFREIRSNKKKDGCQHWVMGQLRARAIGNMALEELSDYIKSRL